MDDAAFAAKILRDLEALDNAVLLLAGADQARPRDLAVIAARERQAETCQAALRGHDLQRLDRLAVQAHHAQAGYWSSQFLDDLLTRPGQKAAELHRRIRGYHEPLHKLVVLLSGAEARHKLPREVPRTFGAGLRGSASYQQVFAVGSMPPETPPAPGPGHPPPVHEQGVEPIPPEPAALKKGKRINERMVAEITNNPTEALKLSLRDWALKFDCAPSTVQGTTAWQRLKTLRKGMKLARQMDSEPKRSEE
jgi:hypothetical protein